MHFIRARLVAGVILGVATAMVSFTPAGLAATKASSPNAVDLPVPAIPGVAPLPGPIAAPAKPASNMGILHISPDQAVAGTPMRISGSHLPAKASVELTWSSANNTWVVDPEPEEQLRPSTHGKGLLDDPTLGARLEDEGGGGVEDGREDRQEERRLVVGGGVEDGRDTGPSDGPDGRVVQVRVEDQHVAPERRRRVDQVWAPWSL